MCILDNLIEPSPKIDDVLVLRDLLLRDEDSTSSLLLTHKIFALDEVL